MRVNGQRTTFPGPLKEGKGTDTIYLLECALETARSEGSDFLVYLISLALAEARSIEATRSRPGPPD